MLLQEGLGADPGDPGWDSSLRGPLRPGDVGAAGAGAPPCSPKPFSSVSPPLLCNDDVPSLGRLSVGFLASFKISMICSSRIFLHSS